MRPTDKELVEIIVADDEALNGVPAPPPAPGVGECWKTIGVFGDGSCVELQAHVHCRNCKVFRAAGRDFWDREPPPGYRDYWTAALAKPEEPPPQETLSVVLFRIGRRWLALETILLKEITEVRLVRPIPHRTNRVLRGLVNIGGELELCVTLAGLLELPDDERKVELMAAKQHKSYRRMIVIERGGDRWVFDADEIEGVRRFPYDQIKPSPVTITKTA
ncbi:MAG: chemotaxis protein CheW, partial [Planctomycetia bacterium]